MVLYALFNLLCSYKKNNKKIFNLKLWENAVEAVKPYFAPQNMFNWAFLERQQSGKRPLNIENLNQVDRKKKKGKIK